MKTLTGSTKMTKESILTSDSDRISLSEFIFQGTSQLVGGWMCHRSDI